MKLTSMRTRLISSRRKPVASALAGLALCLPGLACAQVASGTVDVALRVERGCFVVEQVEDAAAHQETEWGRVDFGAHARLDAPGGSPAAQLDAAVARLECNPDTAYRLEVDDGLHGGAGGVRYLRRERAGTNADANTDAATIAYRLYTDAARRTPWLAGTPVSGVTPADGRVYLPMYAQIVQSATPPPVGRYRDTLHLTLTW
ncbi:Csu type fimbrial protein [Lysobacter enzymogenes]|uniref:Csu type fimbrial protein n=1 Tax=Lysobacter enzymogenes TaxID=69 RepID=UPI00099CB96C|nr:spore coat U domain-containing protein [Lysobacter enzymogenes]UZW62199.1 spore coat U domain-containing protein [Lysobacter enzymogenes]